MWTIPAVQLADPQLARELLLRVCELHGYAPGRGVHYLDGTLFEPGFALEGVAGYAIAAERYIRDTGDDRVVDEPALADTLYMSAEDLEARRDKRVPLYSTEVSPSGEPVAHPFTAARQCSRGARARHLASNARRRDGARPAGSRCRARGDHAPFRRRAARRRPRDVRVVDRSRGHDVDGGRSVSVGVLASDVRDDCAPGFDVSPNGEEDRRHAAADGAAVRAVGRSGRDEHSCSGCGARRSTAASPRRSSIRTDKRCRTAATRRCRDCSRGRHGTRSTRSASGRRRRRPIVEIDGVSCVYFRLAGIAQLVEHNLAKVGVAGSSPVSRSRGGRVGGTSSLSPLCHSGRVHANREWTREGGEVGGDSRSRQSFATVGSGSRQVPGWRNG